MKNIIDVEFTDKENEDINGLNGMYFTVKQVSEMLDLPISTVRYYLTAWKSVLKLSTPNRLNKDEIDKLKYLIELKDKDNMTISQIVHYCSNDGLDQKNKVEVKNTPLTAQMIARAIIQEQQMSLEEFKHDLMTSIDDMIESKLELVKDGQECLRNGIKQDIRDSISNNLTEFNKSISINTEIISDKIDKSLTENISAVTKSLENVTEDIKEIKKTAYVTKDHLDEYKNRSWFNRIFGK